MASEAAQPASTLARLATDQASARRIVDLIAESFEDGETVAGMSEDGMNEDGSGRWAVAIHFRDPPNETAVRALVGLAAGPDAANALAFEVTAPQDWIKKSIEGLIPVEAGRFVVHGSHDRGRVQPNRIAIEIEVSLAFGTGHHASTRGCLLAIDQIVKAQRPRRILDIGTGSGVLAIAAARALHRPVVASDIDRVAVRTARANAQLNGVPALVDISRADGLGPHRLRRRAPYDLILANIVLIPLRRLATSIARVAAPNARVVLSGLLRGEETAAVASYRARGLVLERRIVLGGWVTLVLRRGVAARRSRQ
jgi:ribosomal protein L11 methyltransferase